MTERVLDAGVLLDGGPHAGGDLGSGHDLAGRRPPFVGRCAVLGGLVDGGAGPGSRAAARHRLAADDESDVESTPADAVEGDRDRLGLRDADVGTDRSGSPRPHPLGDEPGDVGVGPRAFGHRDQSAVGEEPSGAGVVGRGEGGLDHQLERFDRTGPVGGAVGGSDADEDRGAGIEGGAHGR